MTTAAPPKSARTVSGAVARGYEGPGAGLEAALESGLTREEYERIVERLGRSPRSLELGLFGAMWSEHCSYKSSRLHLARFPTESPRVLEGPGENAGAVAIGEGLAAVFKVESHNHPTYIEPYQGAATGVGGILRDVFTMGARPVALMNSLRFGPLTDPKNRALLTGAVAGIANYGNSMGIPTVGGEVAFEACYAKNPLVNAFALGIAPADRIFRARAERAGDPVFCVGAKTGRDGIHGASMASAEFGEDAEAKRPTVQVGDPFLEKLLLEACLELMRGDALAAVQDMGAAGLTCSTAETAARGGLGIEMELDLVPRRERGMTGYELMLSESQERMLLVVRTGFEDEVRRVFTKWDLDAVPIGGVTDDGLLRVRQSGLSVAAVPCRILTDDAPAYDRPAETPGWWPEPEVAASDLPEPVDWNEAVLCLAGSPGLASRRWVYEQYDHMVRSDTLARPGADAGVVRIKGKRLALAMSLDGNSRYTARDPRRGGTLAVCDGFRNLAAVGALPVGATNCLNFGNPEKPRVMWRFRNVVEGMREALEAFSVPITGGNVSFYNETEGEGVFPTPVVGMVGILEDAGTLVVQHFRAAGDLLFLAGAPPGDTMGASEYLKVFHRRTDGRPPRPDLDAELRLAGFLRKAARRGLSRSAKDISEGGLLQALVESVFAPDGARCGAAIDLELSSSPLAALFGEAPARALVSVRRRDADALARVAERAEVALARVGIVGGEDLNVRINGARAIRLGGDALWDAFGHGLARAVQGTP